MNTVHPRLRGELSGAVVEALIVGGSSPLTRGTPGSNVRPKDVLRFIPAYAGNSQDTHLVRDLPSVHPRLRGELTIRISMVICTSGSSPLTRGTLNDSPYKALTRTVHPRLRGELLNGAPLSQDQGGSSPLTRGTLFWDFIEEVDERFIPAYAGNSLPVSPTSTLGPVHPRLRGELAEKMRNKGYVPGSSPLTRGTRRDLASKLRKPPVHPRLRGELT